MPTIQELTDERATIFHNATEITETADKAKRRLTQEELETFTRAMDDVDKLGNEIESLKRYKAIGIGEGDDADPKAERKTDPIVNPGRAGDPKDEKEAQFRKAHEAYMRQGRERMSTEDAEVFERYGQPSAESRALGTNIGTAGGFLVPQGFWPKVTETMKWYATVTDVADVLETDTGQNIPWPGNDDTSNVGALLGENTTETEVALAFGKREIQAFTYSSRFILASRQMLQDTGIDLEAFVAKKAGQRLGRITNQHFTTGTGTGQPQGFITGATSGRTATSSSAISYTDTLYLLHSLDVAYRNGATWAFHDSILLQLRLLVDGQSRPLWQPSIANGVPDTFAGYRYNVNNFMDSTMSSGKKTMAFGNFKDGYVVRQVRQPEMIRLEERFADALQVGFLVFARYDGMVQDSSAIKYLVH